MPAYETQTSSSTYNHGNSPTQETGGGLEKKIEWFAQRPEIEGLTVNQRKVIDKSYLKGDPSYSAWLGRVARNVALAELIHVPEYHPVIFDGVDHVIDVRETADGNTSNSYLIHSGKGVGQSAERDRNFSKFRENLYLLRQQNPEAQSLVDRVENEFYEMLSNFRFVPNSPTLMNAGRALQQLSACYVLPIDDTIESWGVTAVNTMLIHKSGGGTGFSGARVRPRNDTVKGSHGVASGPMSPLEIIDKATQELKQGGTRRGANMGILPYNHPDIREFIEYKKKNPGHLQNFNVSVGATEEFTRLAQQGGQYPLINPRTGQVHVRQDGTLAYENAQDIWNLIVESAWETGDPGFILLDRINNSTSNPTPALGVIEATNPCGEQPLLPYEPCNLGSINLYAHTIRNGEKAELDMPKLEQTVRSSVRFLDNVIDVNNSPLPEIERIAKGNRRIGLGIMGLAETLTTLGIPYDSMEGVEKTEQIMKFINDIAHDESQQLGKQRGVFPNFKDSIFDESGRYYRPTQIQPGYQPRNCAVTTIAPTGTIALAAGLQGSGIEPYFAIAYERFTADGLDAKRRREQPQDRDWLRELNPLFEAIAKEHNYFGFTRQELWAKITGSKGSIRHLEMIPEEIKRIFPASHDVPIEFHVRHQAVTQQHTDNAVSKTLNFRNEATAKDVNDAYLLAIELGCKGITIYRDGSKEDQVLNLEAKVSDPTLVRVDVVDKHPRLQVSDGAGGYKISRPEKNMDSLHVLITDELYHDKKGNAYLLPRRDFQVRAPPGQETTVDFGMEGLWITESLKAENPDYARIVTWLKSARSSEEEGMGANRLWTKHHAVGIALEHHLLRNGVIGYDSATHSLVNIVRKKDLTKVEDEEEKKKILNKSGKSNGSVSQIATGKNIGDKFECPECGSHEYTFHAGCHDPVCNCGWSSGVCG